MPHLPTDLASPGALSGCLSNEVLIASLEATADAVVVTSKQGVIQWVNPAFTRLTGYPAGEAMGRDTKLLKSGAHPRSFYQDLWSTILSGHAWTGTLTNRRKDGSLYEEEQTITPIRAENGEITHFVAIKRDHTDHHRLESLLREREKKYRQLFDSGPVAYHQIDLHGRICAVNRRECEMLGYSRFELLGVEVWSLVAPAERSVAQEAVLEKLAGRKPLRPFRREYLCKDGSTIPVAIHETLVRDSQGAISGIHTALIDLSEEVRIQRELDQTHQRYRTLIENSRDSITLYAVSPEGDFLVEDCNPYCAGLRGLTRERMIGLRLEDVFPAQMVEQQRLQLELCARSREAVRYEMERPIPGRLLYFDVQLIPILNEDGTAVRIAGFGHDLSAQKHLEAQLRTQEERLRLVLEGSDDAFWDFDLATGTAFFSPRWFTMLGYEPGELPAGIESWKRLTHPEDRPRTTAAFELHLDGKSPHYECEHRLKTKTGAWRWVLGRGKIVARHASGAPLRMAGTSKDIHEHKVAEDALRDSERKFRSVIAAMAEGVVMQDAAGCIVLWNQSALRILDMTDDEIRGRSSRDPRWSTLLEDGSPFDPEHHPAIVSLKTGQPQRGVIMGLQHTGRPTTWISINAEPLFAGGNPLPYAVVTSFTDITAQKQTNEELRRAKAAAEAAVASKASFLAAMSHELRTPLNGIIGMAGLLRDTPLAPSQREQMDTMRFSASTLLDLINDILDFSKAEAGFIEIRPAPFDFPQLASAIVDLLTPRAREKNLALGFFYPDSAPAYFHGDAGRIRQILLNLTGNAIKFTDSGSVRINASYAGGLLNIEVADTGIGIPAADLPKLFHNYSQTEEGASRGGTGLGLAICKLLAGRMGGQLSVTSTPGGGSNFLLTLPVPVSAPPLPAASAHAVPSCHFPSRTRLLLVEDNPINRTVNRAILEKLHLQVDLANDGVEAVLKAAESTYDLILMDCHMPRKNGFEATAEIRRAEAQGARRTPIVALTASVFREEHKRCLDAGMDAVLTKPVLWDDLLPVLHRFLPRE